MAAQLSPSRTVITSFTPRRPSLTSADGAAAFDDGDWVLCLASPLDDSSASSQQRTIACALSNGQVLVYDQQRLHPVAGYNKVHGSCLSSQLVYGPQNTIISAGMDGTIRLLDPRQGSNSSVGQAMLPQGQAALSITLGFDGYIAAVGSDKARIHFFDLRNTKLLGSYVDSHTDMVPTLSFRPGSSSTLVSGSEDGLVCVFDTMQSTEEAALKSVLNIGGPVRRVGFCGVGGGSSNNHEDSSVYCLTGSETASIWNYDSAMCVQDFGPDLRERLALQAPTLASIDYLVNAHWDAASQELFLTAGNSQGGAALYRLGNSGQRVVRATGSSLDWELSHVLEGGHRGVIRDVCHLSQSVMMTAGEDARLCEWDRLVPQAYSAKSNAKQANPVWMQHHHTLMPAATAAVAASNGGGPIRRPRSRQRSGPY